MYKSIQLASAKYLLLPFVFLYSTSVSSQLMQYEQPLHPLYQEGLNYLKQGDSLNAYQAIQSAHFFDRNQVDIAYHYHLLSIALEKINASEKATKWLGNQSNKIYHSRINFELAKFYFKKQNMEQALLAYEQVSIDDLENKELALMQFHLGYIYFKKGDWEKSTSFLYSIRQVKQSPFYLDANYYAGFVALQKKDFKLALNCFKIAENSTAYKTLTPFYISQLYYFLGEVDAALENTTIALEKKGQYYNDQLAQLMGHLLFEKKQYEKALPN